METNTTNSTTAVPALMSSEDSDIETTSMMVPPPGTTPPSSTEDLPSIASLRDYESRLLAWEVEKHGKIYENIADLGACYNGFTAANYFIDLLNLRYTHRDDFFTSLDPDGQIHYIQISRLTEFIRKWLPLQAAKAGVPSPDSGVAKEIMRSIKYFIRQQDIFVVWDYTRTRIEVKEGSTVSLEELIQDYRNFCDARGAAERPPKCFYRDLTTSIKGLLKVVKKRHIRRLGADGTVLTKTIFQNIALSTKPYETKAFFDGIPSRPVFEGNPWNLVYGTNLSN